MNYRDQSFEQYFESSYRHGNILTPAQFDLASEYFRRDYKNILPQDRDAAILDFGCGAGHFLHHLKKEGYRNFYGIDVAREQIAYCRKHITDRAVVADGREFLKGKPDCYDCITAHDVFEHIPKPEVIELLTVMKASLKETGSLIIRVPNMSNPLGLDARYNDLTHETGYTAKSLRQVLWSAGFRRMEVLPPRTIPVRSLRNWVRRLLVRGLHRLIRFCYYIQDYTVPENLDKNLVVVAYKEGGPRV